MYREQIEEGITLGELLGLIRKNLHIVILWIIGSLVVVGAFTFFIVEAEYQSTSRIVVNQTEGNSENLTSSDINTNLSLITTYQSIIMEPIILEEVIEETDSDASVTELRNKINFQNEPNSLVFGIMVNDENPYMAADIANATASIFRDKIGAILPVESVTILSQAVPNTNPSSPNVMLNLAISLLLGAMIGFGHIFLKEVLDKRVKNDAFITNLGWTNLGSISAMTDKEVNESILPDTYHQESSAPRISRRRI